VKLDLHEADRIVRLYRQKNHKIVSLWNRCGHALNDMVCGSDGQITSQIGYSSDGIVLPNNLLIKYPALRRDAEGYSYIGDARTFRKLAVQRLAGSTDGGIDWTRIYGGKVVENITQAVARIVVSEQMARIGQRYKVVLQVHDEVVVICPENEVAECRAFMEEVMSTPPTWAPDLPVACESGSGVSYGDAK
jgi:DNA polymerase